MSEKEQRDWRRSLISANVTLVLFGLMAAVVWINQPLAEPAAEPEFGPMARLLPPQPAWNDAERLVVDVDEEGNLKIDGRPTQLDSLRDTLEAWRGNAQQVSVTIRADERCRFYHLRKLIQVCDYSVAEYKIQSRPTSGQL